MRHAEAVRLSSGTRPASAGAVRSRARRSFLIASGKRSLARSALRVKSIETKTDEHGRKLVRHKNPPPPPPPVTFRNITPHLRRAFEVLADGRWYPREYVVAEMIKVVDPDMATVVAERRGRHADQRYGEERRKHRATRAELVERGARFLAVGALANASRIEKKDTEQGVMVRLRLHVYGREKTN